MYVLYTEFSCFRLFSPATRADMIFLYLIGQSSIFVIIKITVELKLNLNI